MARRLSPFEPEDLKALRAWRQRHREMLRELIEIVQGKVPARELDKLIAAYNGIDQFGRLWSKWDTAAENVAELAEPGSWRHRADHD